MNNNIIIKSFRESSRDTNNKEFLVSSRVMAYGFDKGLSKVINKKFFGQKNFLKEVDSLHFSEIDSQFLCTFVEFKNIGNNLKSIIHECYSKSVDSHHICLLKYPEIFLDDNCKCLSIAVININAIKNSKNEKAKIILNEDRISLSKIMISEKNRESTLDCIDFKLLKDISFQPFDKMIGNFPFSFFIIVPELFDEYFHSDFPGTLTPLD